MPVALDQLITTFEKQKLDKFTADLLVLEQTAENAKKWQMAYQSGIDRWKNGVTVTNPITGAGIWYDGNAVATVISNRDTWKKRYDDAKLQYDSMTKDANDFLKELYDRYGAGQQLELGAYAQSYGKTLAEKEAETKPKSNILLLLLVFFGVYYFMTKKG